MDFAPIPPEVRRTARHGIQPPASAQKGDLQAEPPGGVGAEPADHALGRSWGGLTTKLHLGCEQGQKPLSLVLTAGQRGDSTQSAGRPRGERRRRRPGSVPATARTGRRGKGRGTGTTSI
jgi:hypothetical protein